MAAASTILTLRRRSARLLQSTALATLLVVPPAAAQVTPGGANAPRRDVARNGTPIVKINAPNKRGVSNNTYRDFNVDARGLILNNSAKIVTTNLAGFIDGNGNLTASGPAGLILNQVVSTNPSTLSGYMEVAGSPAQVVVANANGITCNGCGFINSPWATLTTGTVQFGPDGGIAGYQIDRGAITVGAGGLDASGMRLELFARAVAVNGGIYADRIDASFGAADIGVDGNPDGEIVVTARRPGEAAPRFGIDVAALGGMYANSIRLIGTEAGLGVRVDGTLASLERGFTLTAAGDIELSGKAVAATTATVRTSGGVSVTGTLYADTGVTVSADGAVAASGLIASGTDLRLDVGSLASTGTIASGLRRDGTLGAVGMLGSGGALSLRSPGTIALAGQTVAPGALTINAGTLDLSGGTTQADSASIEATAVSNRAGQLAVAGQLGIVTGSLTNGGLVQARDLAVTSGTVVNDGGTLNALSRLDLTTAAALSNVRGTIQSGDAMTIRAGSLANAGGSIVNTSTAATAITVGGAIASQGGTIGGNGDVVVDAGSILVGGAEGRLIAGRKLTATARAGAIDASAGGLIASGGDAVLTAAGAIDARGGTISVGGAASLKASSLIADGGTLVASAFVFDVPTISLRRGRIEQTGTNDFTIVTAGELDYSGARIASGGNNFTLGASRLVNVGGEILHTGAGLLRISVAGELLNRDGRVATNGNLALTARSVDGGSGSISALRNATLAITGGVDNSLATLAAGGRLALTAGAVSNAGGVITAGGALDATVASLTGDRGRLVATGTGALNLGSTGAVSARSGVIGGNGDVTLRVGALDVGGVGGQLVAGGLLDLASRGDIRADGATIGGGVLDLSAGGTLDASGGTIQAAMRARVAADRLVNDRGLLIADTLEVAVGGLSNTGGDIVALGTGASRISAARLLDNTGGTIQANGGLAIAAGDLANTGGAIAHAGSGTLSIAVAGGIANGPGGSIATNGALALDANRLVNRGTIASTGAARIGVAGALDNARGAIGGDGGLTLAAGSIDNNAGRIVVTGDAALQLSSVGAVTSRSGTIGGNGTVFVRAGSIDVGGDGQLSAARALDLVTNGDARAVGGVIAGGTLRASVGGALDASGGGTIETVGAAAIEAGTVNLDGGALLADSLALRAGALTLRSGGVVQSGRGPLAIDVAGLLDLSGGSIETEATDARIRAGTLDNVGGRILAQSAGLLAIDAGTLLNTGRIASNGRLALGGTALVNNGTISALGDTTVRTGGGFDNRSGTLATAGALTVAAGSLVNRDGTISGATGVRLSGGNVNNDGGTLVAGQFGTAGDAAALVIGIAGNLTSRGGLVAATGAVTADARSMDFGAGGRLTGARVAANATAGDLALRGGTIDAGALALTASGSVDASADGLLQGETVDIRAGTLDTSGGNLVAGSLDVGVATLRNRGGAISVTGTTPLAIVATGTLDNGAGGVIATNATTLTLRAGTLLNVGGTIAHAGTGTLTLASAGLFDNRRGTVAGNGGYAISATDFLNDDATLSSAGSIGIALRGALSNRGGTISASGPLTIGAGSVGNGGGTLLSDGALALSVGGIVDNDGGLIGSRRGLTLAAGSLTNRDGVVAAADTALALGSLVNNGEISAAGRLSLAVRGAADNAGGVLTASNLALEAASFRNGGGFVTAGGPVALRIAGALDNDAGVIGGPGAVTMTAGSLSNGGTISSGADLAIVAADTLTNRSTGAIYAAGDAALTARLLTNAGSIGAGEALRIAAAELDNSAGAIGADGLLSLRVGTARFGRLGIARDFALDLTGDSTVRAGETIEAPRDLSLTIGGTLTNAGTIRANRALALSAGGNLDNQAGGLITAADLTVSAGGLLTNAGLIDGLRTELNTGQLVNTGLIFGDSVTINARGSVDNLGAGAVVATREGTLAILTPGAITNADGAMLFSLGDLLITGANGEGRAASLTNSSASIEVAGNAFIGADAITNRRTLFEVADVTTRTSVPDFRVFPPRRGYERTVLRYDEVKTETTITQDSGEALLLVGGDLAISTAALANAYSTISAGGDLSINGSVDGSASGVVTNTSLVGTRVIDREGRYRSTKDGIIGNVHVNDPYSFHSEETTFVVDSVIRSGGTLTIDGAAISNLTLDARGNSVGDIARAVGVGRQSVLADARATGSPSPVGGAAAVAKPGTSVEVGAARFAAAGTASLNVDGEGSGVEAASGNVGLTTLADAAIGRVTSSSAPGGAPAVVARFAGSSTPAFSITVGGLFQFAAGTGGFLIETNPAFTNQRSFLSSSYFLDRLGYDPTRIGKRLGDALYEQQLVGRQLATLTGTTRLTGYADNDTQYRALMDAGVTVAQKFQLGLGVALTPEQTATLTSDIVLMVYVTVDTPTGPQQVLAPVVYLAKVRPGDVRGSGALIAGNAIVLRSADALTNSGVIRASAGSRIDVATLTNGGTIDAGRVGTITTAGDLTSRGGAIRGGDLTLRAGGNIDLAAAPTTTRFATSTIGSVARGTMLTNRVSIVDASGDLKVVAVGNLTSQGAQLSAGGAATVLVGGTADLGVAVDRLDSVTKSRIKNGRMTETVSDETVIGTSITAGRDVTVAAGLLDPAGKLNLNGGTIASASGPVALSGTGGVSIATANEHDRFGTDTRTKKSGLLSSTKTKTQDALTADTAIGSTVSGERVTISSEKGGIAIAGSNVVADGDVTLSALGPVSIGTAETRTLEESSRSVKKSGLSVSIGGGGINAFAGVAKNSQASTASAVTNVGSLVGSTGGDVTIVSGGAARVTGSQIVTPGDVRIAANSITIENATDTLVSTNTTKSSSVGVSLNVGSPVIAGASTVARMGETAATTTNARTAGVAAVAGGLAAKNTYDAVTDKNAPLANASVSLGISKSSSRGDAREETAVGSLIQGNDVSLTATGAGAAGTIGVRGSDVLAANDLTLAANGAIDLRGASQTSTASGSSKSSGASIGIGADLGRNGKFTPPTITAGVSGTRGTSSSTETTWRETNLAAGGTATVATPGALTLDAATLSGGRVEVGAGSLDIISRQDTASSRSNDKSFGASVSFTPSTGAVSGSVNAGRTTTSGDFASVAEQSGIFARDGGFGIKVAGNTALTGAVIASEAEASRNSLSTGTLSATDLLNRESYKASSVNVGFGLGGNVGRDARGTAQTGNDKTPGSSLPGIPTPLGKLTATPPVALGAAGKQSGTTASAIAPGTITITSDDAASAAVAATIGRDTGGANAGALTAEFNDAKRAEIAEGFDATRQLTAEVGTFFANRASDQKKAEEKAIEAGVERNADGSLRRDSEGRLIALNSTAQGYVDTAAALQKNYGGGSAARLIATALTGAAGSNVTGSLGGLVQASAVNVIQGLAVTQVKRIADSLYDKNGNPTAGSEGVRAALQAVTGCAGSAAGGSGSCGSAATGAAASVVTNYLLTRYVDPKPEIDPLTGRPTPRSLEDQEARKNLVTTIIAGIAVGAGLDTNAAVTSAQVETENNDLITTTSRYQIGKPGQKGLTDGQLLAQPDVRALMQATGLTAEQVVGCARSNVTVCSSNVQEVADKFGAQLAALSGGDPQRQQRLVADLANGTVSGAELDRLGTLYKADPRLATALVDQPQAVRDLVYRDIATDAGNNIVGRLSGSALGSVFSEQTLLSLYLANKREIAEQNGTLPRTGSFDQAIADANASATRDATAQRDAADAEARRMAARGVSQQEIDAYVAGQYRAAYADQTLAAGLLSQGQFLGDYFFNPAEVAKKVAVGITGGIDGALRDETPVLEYLRRTGQSVDDYRRADVRTRARIEGEAIGSAATVAADVALAKGTGAAASSVARGATVVADAVAARRSVASILSESAGSPLPMQNATNLTTEIAPKSVATGSAPNGGSWSSPYLPGSVIRTYTTTQETVLVRVSTGSPSGGFYAAADELVGKTPEQVRVFLALPETPTYIQSVRVPAGTILKEGKIGPQPGFTPPIPSSAGGTQFQALGRLPRDSFGPLVPIRSRLPSPPPKR